jgi:hypothetical protein
MTARLVLDYDGRLASVDEPVQQRQQLLHVAEVQAGGRLIEDVDVRRMSASWCVTHGL